ncbi:cyclodeaminase/cyclohydrolase family protein [Floccifex sp.]|uniref:cyclodeaminase/cyclohydrolase family protein n=1 Tax=Floccifex sp. TaxID=2815810 RepID=UPI002A78A9B5|nr:cyclodeaminase/cyclohydrolase family protein [Erysipelotrichaceae bacterium]MDY2958858.1 cyclodeaminase/cyclohydrolase family protein [Floccifex sp.]
MMDIENYTKVLSSNSPTPGGGGTSALVGALAASLGSMVGNLTVNKKKYVDVQEEILVCLEKSEQLRIRLLKDIQKDAQAFEPLSKAYGIDKTNSNREQILEQCLKQAANAPFEIVKDVCEVIDVLEVYGTIGSKLAISDAATGAALAHGALKGAYINVLVNTRLMKDKDYALNLEKQVNELVDEYSQKALLIYNSVLERI